MEMALNKTATTYSRYGSTTHKQVYIYGGLNTGPIELTRNYGQAWGVGGWLLTPFLQKIGRPEQARLRERVVNGPEDDLRQPLHQDDLAAGGARSQEHRRLQQARDRREVLDQSEQVSDLASPDRGPPGPQSGETSNLCHPERSEGSHGISTSAPFAIAMGSFASLRMTDAHWRGIG